MLILDHETFRRGFLDGQQWYFEEIHGQGGCPPERPERALRLSSEEILDLIVVPISRDGITLTSRARRASQNIWAISSAI